MEDAQPAVDYSEEAAIVVEVVVAIDMEFVVVVVQASRPTLLAHRTIQEHRRFTVSVNLLNVSAEFYSKKMNCHDEWTCGPGRCQDNKKKE